MRVLLNNLFTTWHIARYYYVLSLYCLYYPAIIAPTYYSFLLTDITYRVTLQISNDVTRKELFGGEYSGRTNQAGAYAGSAGQAGACNPACYWKNGIWFPCTRKKFFERLPGPQYPPRTSRGSKNICACARQTQKESKKTVKPRPKLAA